MSMILAIDTAGPEASVALAAEGSPIRSESLPQRGHSEELSSVASRLLREAGVVIGGLAAIAVAEGPGSFTGLRIGLAWAKGALWGTSVPLILVPSHEALAVAHLAPGRKVASIVPGERGHAEAALWGGGPPPTLLWGPSPIEEDALVERLLELADGDRILLAPMTPKIAAAIEDQIESDSVSLAPMSPLAPSVAEIAHRLLRSGRTTDWASASPAYGRAPNARKPTP